MDILNFISWIRGGRVVTTVDPNKTLIPVGLKDGRRDDDYLAGAISVADLAAEISPAAPYKVYTALLNQSGTNAPVATVLQNTLEGVPVWARTGTGLFTITLTGQFPIDKTVCFLTIIGNGDSDGRKLAEINYSGAPNANKRGFVFQNARTDSNSDGIGANSCIEIRVYP